MLSTVWKSSKVAAIEALKGARLSCNFDIILSKPGVDFLRPHGGNKYPSIAMENDQSLPEEALPTPVATSTDADLVANSNEIPEEL